MRNQLGWEKFLRLPGFGARNHRHFSRRTRSVEPEGKIHTATISGKVFAPAGLCTMIVVPFVGYLLTLGYDPRKMVFFGLVGLASSFWWMFSLNLETAERDIIFHRPGGSFSRQCRGSSLLCHVEPLQSHATPGDAARIHGSVQDALRHHSLDSPAGAVSRRP
jgi:hypothetical protein